MAYGRRPSSGIGEGPAAGRVQARVYVSETTTGSLHFIEARAAERAAAVLSQITNSRCHYPPQAGHCQVLALQRQSNWWLAAGQATGRAGMGSSMLGGAGRAAGGSPAAGACSALLWLVFSTAGMLSEML